MEPRAPMAPRMDGVDVCRRAAIGVARLVMRRPIRRVEVVRRSDAFAVPPLEEIVELPIRRHSRLLSILGCDATGLAVNRPVSLSSRCPAPPLGTPRRLGAPLGGDSSTLCLRPATLGNRASTRAP